MDLPAERLTVGILLFDDVEVLDFAGPFEVFSRTRLEPGVDARRDEASAPFRVVTVSVDEGPVTATGGLRVLADHTLADAPALDLLLIPGGFGSRALLGEERVQSWIRQRAEQARLVASVCTGALVLADAGLLAGRRATTHWCALDALAEIDATIRVEETRVVSDGVLTSAGVAAGIDLAFEIVAGLCGEDVACETASYIEYPYVPAGTTLP